MWRMKSCESCESCDGWISTKLILLLKNKTNRSEDFNTL